MTSAKPSGLDCKILSAEGAYLCLLVFHLVPHTIKQVNVERISINQK